MEAHSAGLGTERLETARFFAMDLLNLLLILMFCGILGYLRWVKLATLVSGDTPRWLFEAQRVAAGQAPYRDFSWQYPPFSVLLFGWAMRWFGVTFAVAQVFLDAVSLAIVLAGFSLARLLLPRFLLVPTMFCFVAVCGTSLTFFNLFSLLTYIPALQISVAGFLFFLLGVLSYVRTGELKASTWLLISFGAFVASYGKPETLVATFTTLLFLAILDRNYWFEERKITDWLLHYAKLCAACSVPAVVAYVWSGTVYGYSDMLAGISGYGLAKAQCPWWPTGLGVFGAASSLGEALFIVSALSLTRRKYFAARLGYFYYYTLAAGLCGACVYFAYVYYNNHELLSGNRSLLDKIWYSGQSTFWTSAVLLPVMWTCVFLWAYLIFRFLILRKQRLSADHFTLIVLLTGPVAMSARGWFNWNQEIRTAVPGACYPFFLVLAPYLLWRALALAAAGPDIRSESRSMPAIAVTALLVVYSTLRIVASYPSLLSNAHYREMSTLAGNVRLADYQTNAEIYRFVIDNTSSSDPLLDLPYGGGINFATHRLGPLFQTQFQQLSMPERFLDKDLEAIRQNPPKVVIADNLPNYGASYGLKNNSCPFPRLVWTPQTNAVPDQAFPAILYIQQHYRVARVVGQKVLLIPK